ncbi:MAG: UDP-N-acetylmuramate dehydrogenase [Bacteroidales bacterium]|nr:UDP-N-acetylmuramate dehydrogenase [Bacteroidales bacterium]
MMVIEEQKSLQQEHTFGIQASTRYFIEINRDEDIVPVILSLTEDQKPIMILGDGSNVLFTENFPGTVIRLNTKGIAVISENEEFIIVRVAGGEIWDEVVAYCVERGWGGVENLSLIPGRIGASPIQNIGAYGVELKEVLEELETVHLETGEKRTFSRDDCRFGYRESIFQQTLRGQYFITGVTLKLAKKPTLNLGYGSVKQELERSGITSPTIKDVREVVCRIRRSKLPDPRDAGNAGSFFRNPVIRTDQFAGLKQQYPDIVSFADSNGVKLAAAWLIDQCNWKGKRAGDAGVHPDQPLVLVNYGNATGVEILALASLIRQSVLVKFGILLEPEVNIL